MTKLHLKPLQKENQVENIKHLRIFGSIYYSHIPSNLRQKLDEKTSKGVFIGYDSYEKGYRAYNLQSEKIVLSRSVLFDENKSWNWENKQVESPYHWILEMVILKLVKLLGHLLKLRVMTLLV